MIVINDNITDRLIELSKLYMETDDQLYYDQYMIEYEIVHMYLENKIKNENRLTLINKIIGNERDNG